jgi:hypothetical protein
MLVAPDFAPITYAFGLLEPPLHEVVAALREWKAEIKNAAVLTPVEVGLSAGLRMLEPLGAPWFNRLWIGTTSTRWRTAYFDGSINGGDPFPPISYLAEKMRCLGLVVVAQPDSVQIQEYGPDRTEWLNLRWAVVATNDDPWYWQHFGEMRSFEESDNYTKRRTKDRFTLSMLRRYCLALGVPLEADAFGPDAVIECPIVPSGEHRFETLAQARARLQLA